MTKVEDAVFRGGGADLGFQHEAGFGIMRAGVADRLSIPRIDDGDFTVFPLDGVNEPGLLALDQWGQPDDSQNSLCEPVAKILRHFGLPQLRSGVDVVVLGLPQRFKKKLKWVRRSPWSGSVFA